MPGRTDGARLNGVTANSRMSNRLHLTVATEKFDLKPDKIPIK